MSRHKIICGHWLDVSPTLKSESVDMLMTSPPYFGLRNYGEDTATVWGDSEDCEHTWIEHRSGLIHENRNNLKGTQEEVVGKTGTTYIKKFDDKKAGFCTKCHSWYGQLGLEPSPELYIIHLRMVFAEVKRVLKRTGTVWANIADTYGGSWGDSYSSGRGGGDSQRPQNFPSWYRNAQPKERPPQSFIKSKCMCLIPEDFVSMMVKDLGFILRNKICWAKNNPMPSSTKDRFNTTWEYLFFFVKNNKPVYFYNDKSGTLVDRKPTSQIEGVDWDWKEVGIVNGDTFNVWVRDAEIDRFLVKATEKEIGEYGKPKFKKVSHWHGLDYWFDLDAVREEHKPESLKRVKGNWNGHREPMSSYQGMDIKRMCSQSGKNPGDKIEMSKEEWLEYCVQLWDLSREYPDVFNINTQPFAQCHFAVFPEKLVEKPLKCGCPAEVCKYCGKARVRITKTTTDENNIPKEGWKKSYKGKVELDGSPQDRSVSELFKESLSKRRETTGWSDCSCPQEDKYEPGVVLDIFAGSGTVGRVAEELGRSSILVDIKPDYCEMAFKRLKQLVGQTKLTGKISKIERIGF